MLLFSQAQGERDKQKANSIVQESLTLLIVVLLFLALIGNIFPSFIVSALGVTPELYKLTIEYIPSLLISFIFTGITYFLLGVVQADSNSRLGTISMFVQGVLTVVFAVLFMGVFDLGIKGSALTLIASSIITTGVLCSHFFSRKSSIKLSLRMPSLWLIKKQAKYLVSNCLDEFIGMWAIILINYLLLRTFPLEVVTIFLIVYQSCSYTDALLQGVKAATCPLVSTFFGEHNQAALMETIKQLSKRVIGIGLVGTLCVFVLAPIIPNLFNYRYEEFMPTAIIAVRIFSFSIPLIFLVNLFAGVFTNTNNLKKGVIISQVANVWMPLLIALIAIQTHNTSVLWLFHLISYTISLLLLGVYIFVNTRKKSFVEFMRIPDSKKEYKGELCILIKPEDSADMEEYQQMTEMFLSVHQVEERKNYRTVQIVGEIMEYALATNHKKRGYIDIKIVVLRNNEVCIMAKLSNNIVNIDNVDQEDDNLLSLHLIQSMSKSLNYNRVLSFNTLDITV